MLRGRKKTKAGATGAKAIGYEETREVVAKSGKEARSRRDKVRKPLGKQSSSADQEDLHNTLVQPMRSATTAGVCGRTYSVTETPRKIGEEVLAWQASQGCQHIPNRRSLDIDEKKLAKRFEDVLRRRYCDIGERPCQRQLSADDLHFINRIPGVPLDGCPVKTASPGVVLAHSRPTLSRKIGEEVRKIGEEVLAWQASQGCQHIPNRRSPDNDEKKLGKRFDDVLRRQYQAIGGKHCQRQLSQDEVDFIKEILANTAPPVAPEATVLIEGSAKRRRLSSKTRDCAPLAQAFCASPRGERRRAVELEGAQSTSGETAPVAAELVQVERWHRLVRAIMQSSKTTPTTPTIRRNDYAELVQLPTVAEVSRGRAISQEKQSARSGLATAEQFDVDNTLYPTQEAEMVPSELTKKNIYIAFIYNCFSSFS